MAVTVVAQKVLAVRPAAKAPKAAPVVSKKVFTQEKLMAAVTAGTAAAMTNPLVAEAAVTPSLSNLLKSVVAGGVVLGAIFGAITVVSQFDPVSRK